MTTEYTREEVAKHNQRGDLWIVIHKKVYNVTKFILEHPGGEEVLEDNGGRDATVCFDDIGHSMDAKTLMQNYQIGVIVEKKHPGGEEVLLEQAGKDATEAFEDVAHSSDAREIMVKYKIGELVEADRTKVKQTSTKDWASESEGESSSSSSWRSWLIPFSLSVFATLLYRFYYSTQSHSD